MSEKVSRRTSLSVYMPSRPKRLLRRRGKTRTVSDSIESLTQAFKSLSLSEEGESTALTTRRHSDPTNGQGRVTNMNKKQQLYKTELCRNWETLHRCRYREKCQYAHGKDDLRKVEGHPKYKTQHCRTFRYTGSCTYNARCMFRHQDLPVHYSMQGDLFSRQHRHEHADAPSDSGTSHARSVRAASSVWPTTTTLPWFRGNEENYDDPLPSQPESLLPLTLLSDLSLMPCFESQHGKKPLSADNLYTHQSTQINHWAVREA